MKNYIGVKIVKAEPQEKDGKAGNKIDKIRRII